MSENSALTFQTAPFESLCGCVSALIPSHLLYQWKGRTGNEIENPEATRGLIERSEGNRIVSADCPKCGGTGLNYQHALEQEVKDEWTRD